MSKLDLTMVRQIYYDKYFLGLNNQGIAEKNGISYGHVLSALYGKRQYIRRWMKLGFLGDLHFMTKRKEHGKPIDGIRLDEYVYSDGDKIDVSLPK